MKKGILSVVVFFLAFIFTSSIQASSFLLPDTGQTTCYDALGNVIDSCPVPGDPQAQDGSYYNNPMSFTVIGVNSDMVQDNNTGLIWQRYENLLRYNWYQASGTYEANLNSSSQDICGSLNLGGSSDWRLPSKKELMSIVDYSISYPLSTINTTYFPNTFASFYWSSTTYASSPGDAWYVLFGTGSVGDTDYGHYGYKSRLLNVRCVLGGQLDFGNFHDNKNGTVTDNSTGLMWQQDEPGAKTWTDALKYCEELELPPGSGQTDWRLPNIKELASITDDTIYDPNNPIAINRTAFPNASGSDYWSSTTYASGPSDGWYVGFNYGYVTAKDKQYYSKYVRCVRHTPDGLAFPFEGKTPYTAVVSAVMDHSMTTPYRKDGVAITFNGEEGRAEYGCWCYTTNSPCNSKKYKSCTVPGYKNKDKNHVFVPTLNYGDTYIYYDGHPGYDYPATLGTSIDAPADGILCIATNQSRPKKKTLWRDPTHCPYSNAVSETWNGYHAFYIVHSGLLVNGNQGDYITVFLHNDSLDDSVSSAIVRDGYAQVTKYLHIANVGGYGPKGPNTYHSHMHLEVYKRNGTTWDRVDPYGNGVNDILWDAGGPPAN